jgi:hypothetical protein
LARAVIPDSIAVTFFENFAAQSKREVTHTISSLAELIRATSAPSKDKLPWLKLCRFGNIKTEKGSFRHDGNVSACSGIEADYDGELVSIDEAIERLDKAGIHAVVYSSPSHTDEKPRWRVICPFSRELPPAERGHMLGRVNGLLGGILADESFTLSQSYYYGSVNGNPAHRVEIVDGTQYIDQANELDERWIGRSKAKANGGGGNGQFHSGPVDEAALIEEIISGKSYHLSCTRLVGRWAQQGMPFMDAQTQLLAIFDGVYPPDRDERWRQRHGDVPRIIRDIYGKQAGQSDAKREPNGQGGWNVPPQEHPRPAAKAGNLRICDAGDIDVTKLPPRGWLLGVAFCRKFISGLVGEGGGGKTAVRYVQYMAGATGRKLTDEHVHHRFRTLIVCLEDDFDEVERRIGAVMLHHKVTPDDVRGWLHYCTPQGLKLLQSGQSGTRVVGELYAELRTAIETLAIDLVSIDPFVKSHGVEENDNNAIDEVCIMLAGIAAEFNCAVDLVSHARKGGATPGDAERDRGASAKRDAGRLMRTITGISPEEAETYGLNDQERRALIRVDDAKINLTVKNASAMWFQLIGVALGNRTALYPSGDEVQTAVRWYPPDAFAGIGSAAWGAIIDDIDAGLSNGQRFSNAGHATDRAAWYVVVKHLPDRTEKQARSIVNTWVKNGVLLAVKYDDPVARKELSGLKANPAKRPG